ncbi:2-oxoacid:acceptor oxidoreductase subunit alpha [Acetobacterium bakii]|uniref:2-oxoacid:ferredoxin oxidoreductase subunit alpha n=1 Tax=Acetobacterium bakii TaxID=52689 RepID=A0A0L6U010_9FIRM|nr:2-oxoacid:acceptor oxidoreductase subunit alpha [Acetobacterium bakii]KNZ41834.1 2-oxoacid:ferredoxin oxidoreductase subunit alpha [Acetobacterium bakii]
MYNILLGGAAGDGIETMSSLLERTLKKSGCYVFSIRDFMSRVRGGHNFAQVRFASEAIAAHRDTLDGIFAVDQTTYDQHHQRLHDRGFILCDVSLNIEDPRAIKLPLKEIAKRLGNPKVMSSVAIGALLKLFSFPLDYALEVIPENLRPDLVDVNLKAVTEGFDAVESQFQVTAKNAKQDLLLTGNTALSLGALAANIKFYSAYPMSPSTTILDYLAAQSAKMNIVVEQAEDEIAAINMVLGASYAGARAMTGTSGGGFSLMVEALGFAGIAEIPVVIANIQRPGPATGFPTRTEQSDLKFVISASQGEFPRMVIALRDHTDCFFQTARAFGLAEKYQMPVILLSDQYLADSAATVAVFDTNGLYSDLFPEKSVPGNETKPYRRYQLTESGISPNSIPGETESLVRIDSDEHDEFGQITESADVRIQMVDKRMNKLELLKKELLEPDFWGDEQCETLLIGFGSTAGAIKEAITILNAQGGHYGALLFGDVYPLPQQKLKQYAALATEMVNVEQNATGQLASLIRENALISCHRSILKYDGRQMSVDDILAGIQNPKGGQLL